MKTLPINVDLLKYGCMKNINKKSIFVVLFAVVFAFGPSVTEAKFDLFKKGQRAQTGPIPATQTPTVDCDTPLYARVKFNSGPFGARNWGTGNVEKQVYVGGSAETDKYLSGEWFPLYNGINPIIDAPIASYEDVPGLAVQRLADSVRIVLHGSWTQPAGAPLTNRERVQATLEFSDNMSSRSVYAIPTSQVSDTEHQVDFEPGHGTNHPQSDKIRLANNLSHFKFVVNTNDDGFYTNYAYSLPAECL